MNALIPAKLPIQVEPYEWAGEHCLALTARLADGDAYIYAIIPPCDPHAHPGPDEERVARVLAQALNGDALDRDRWQQATDAQRAEQAVQLRVALCELEESRKVIDELWVEACHLQAQLVTARQLEVSIHG